MQRNDSSSVVNAMLDDQDRVIEAMLDVARADGVSDDTLAKMLDVATLIVGFSPEHTLSAEQRAAVQAAEELAGAPVAATTPQRDSGADLVAQIAAKLSLPTPPHSDADPFSHLADYRSLEKVARLAEVERRMAVLSAIDDQRHLTDGEAEAWYRLKRSLRALTEA